jgi:serine/threonine protein kinase
MQKAKSIHIFPQYLQSIRRTNAQDEILTVLSRPTTFVSDAKILQQLNKPEEWIKIADFEAGKVYSCRWLGQNVVVKWCNDQNNDLSQEILMNFCLHHPNIVTFYIASPSAIILEQMNCSLAQCLKTRSEPPAFCTRLKYCIDLVNAVYYLHAFDIIHGDINTDNALLKQATLKLSDFNGSFFQSSHSVDHICDTEMYLPLTKRDPSYTHTDKSASDDIYAMICVILQIVTWQKDLYKLLQLEFFEREFMKSTDKPAYIADCNTIAVRSIAENLDAHVLSCELQQLIQHGFCGIYENSVTFLEQLQEQLCLLNNNINISTEQ